MRLGSDSPVDGVSEEHGDGHRPDTTWYLRFKKNHRKANVLLWMLDSRLHVHRGL